MKTNRFARAYLRVRGTLFCLGLVAMVGASFSVGATLAKRVTPARVPQAQMLVPNVSMADFMSAAR